MRFRARAGQVVNGDQVIVLSGLGDYNPGRWIADPGQHRRRWRARKAAPGDPRRRDRRPQPHRGPATIHDLRIEQASGTAGLYLDSTPGGLVAERVFVSYAGASGGGACQFTETS